MEPLVILLIVCFFVLAVGIAANRKRLTDQAWSDFTAKHELTYQPPGLFQKRSAEGRVGPMPIRMWQETRSAGKRRTTWTLIEVDLGVPPVTMAPEGVVSSFFTALGGEDIQLGHPELDSKLVLKGDEVTLRALLDARGRRGASVIRDQLQVRDGKVHFQLKKTATSADQLQGWFDQTMALAHDLHGDGGRVIDRLADVPLDDPHPIVAERALELLLSRSSVEQARSMATRCLDSHHPGVRCLAAERVGALDVLHALVAPEVPEKHWRRALEALAVRETPAGLRSALQRALELSRGEARVPILKLAAAKRVGGLTAPLMALTHLSLETAARVALADALACQGPVGGVWLIAQLGVEEPVEVRIAAAHALGQVGDLGAIEALVEAQATVGITQRRLLGALREAVTAIQDRAGLDGSMAGAVTLSAPVDGGALSLAEAESSAQRRGHREREVL